MNRRAQPIEALRAVARNRNLRRVELAWGASIAAEWAHFVGLGVFAYAAGGTSAVGIAGLVRMLPAALVAPVAATFGDRFRRERFLLVIALVGCAALGASAAAYFAGRNEAAIFALAGVVGVASTLFRPAMQAILPSLARTAEELIASNGATSTIESVGTLVGPLVAGILVAAASPGLVFVVASPTLLVAAALLARVQVEGRIQPRALPAGRSAMSLVGDGFRTVASMPRPRLIVGLIAAQGLVRGCLNVLIVVAVFRLLRAGEGAVGYMTAALGAGGLIGAFGALFLEGGRLAVPLGVALFFWGAPIALVAAWPHLAAALLLLAVVGAANSVEDVAGFTLLQRIVPDVVLTRVLGVTWGLVMGAVGLGSLVAPPLVAAIGPRAAFVLVGAILPFLTLLAWRWLVEIDRKVAPPVELDMVDSVPIFAPLSVAAKEYLAAKLVEVPVGAGEVVVRRGDTGDRFYIVASGELEVATDGTRAHSGRGDFFGEIALLRDVPRTATVTATAPSRLYALDREDFLAAVTGHSGVRSAGEAVASERLGRG